MKIDRWCRLDAMRAGGTPNSDTMAQKSQQRSTIHVTVVLPLFSNKNETFLVYSSWLRSSFPPRDILIDFVVLDSRRVVYGLIAIHWLIVLNLQDSTCCSEFGFISDCLFVCVTRWAYPIGAFVRSTLVLVLPFAACFAVFLKSLFHIN